MNPRILDINTHLTPEELAAKEAAEAATQEKEKESQDPPTPEQGEVEKVTEVEEPQYELDSDKKKPNIIHVGNEVPLTKINNGMSKILLPSVEEQASAEEVAEKEVDGVVQPAYTVYKGKPFYHKKAGTIRQLFPDQYKEFTEKGK